MAMQDAVVRAGMAADDLDIDNMGPPVFVVSTTKVARLDGRGDER